MKISAHVDIRIDVARIIQWLVIAAAMFWT